MVTNIQCPDCGKNVRLYIDRDITGVEIAAKKHQSDSDGLADTLNSLANFLGEANKVVLQNREDVHMKDCPFCNISIAIKLKSDINSFENTTSSGKNSNWRNNTNPSDNPSSHSNSETRIFDSNSESTEYTSSNLKCPECGCACNHNSNFCSNCGKSL